MNIHLNRDGVLKFACAMFLASALGVSTTGAEASGCVVTRSDAGTTIIDISKGMHCDAKEPRDAGWGRPGTGFVSEVA